MEWVRKSDYHIESADGRYSVAAVFVDGERFYEAWRISGSGRSRTGTPIAARLPDADVAKDACWWDAEALDEPGTTREAG